MEGKLALALALEPVLELAL